MPKIFCDFLQFSMYKAIFYWLIVKKWNFTNKMNETISNLCMTTVILSVPRKNLRCHASLAYSFHSSPLLTNYLCLKCYLFFDKIIFHFHVLINRRDILKANRIHFFSLLFIIYYFITFLLKTINNKNGTIHIFLPSDLFFNNSFLLYIVLEFFVCLPFFISKKMF